MRRRLPLLRIVLVLTAALLVAAVVLLGLVRVPEVVTAPGTLAVEGPGAGPSAAPGDTGAAPVPGRFVAVAEDGARLRLYAGQTAAVRLEAYPWMHKGTLSARVASVAAMPGGGKGLRVTLTVDPASAPGPLLEGLRGEARIATGHTELLGRLLFARFAEASR